MADASIIQELLRQDFLRKQQQQAQPQQDMTSMIDAVMKGIQIYDSVKGLGTKYDKPGPAAVPAQPGMAPLANQGAPMGSQITPFQGFPVPGGAPGVSGNTPPNLQALMATLQPQAGTPATPAIPAGPPQMGSNTAELFQRLQNTPQLLQQQATQRGYGDIGPVIPEQKVVLATKTEADKNASTNKKIDDTDAQKKAEEDRKRKKDEADAADKKRKADAAATAIDRKAKLSGATAMWKKLGDALQKGDVPDQLLSEGIKAGKLLGYDTSDLEKPKTSSKWWDTAKSAIQKQFASDPRQEKAKKFLQDHKQPTDPANIQWAIDNGYAN